MPKVSVIIPVYGVEKYIERCARSLFKQTLNDMEFIFVDDCTPDNSIQILENVLSEFPSRKTQTTILHHLCNLGLPQARRTGIKFCHGDYVIHCDSDDWVDTDLYEAMYDVARRGDYDLIVCNAQISDGSNCSIAPVQLSDSKEQYIDDILQIRSIWPVWNKLTRREFYTDSNLKFPLYNMGEDLAFSFQILASVKSVSYVTDKYYYYFYNSTSISKNKSADNILKCFEQANKNMQIVIDTAVRYGIEEDRLLVLKNKQRNIIIPAIRDRSTFRKWLSIYEGLNVKLLLSTLVPLKEKIRFIKVLLSNFKYWF